MSLQGSRFCVCARGCVYSQPCMSYGVMLLMHRVHSIAGGGGGVGGDIKWVAAEESEPEE